MEIYNKLQQARKMTRETDKKKKGRNEYSKYDYFTPEQVEKLVSDACEKTNLLTLCNFLVDEYGYYQKLTLINLDDANEFLEFTLRTEKGEMSATNDTQKMGGTDTYSERYLKMKVFQIKDNNIDFDSYEGEKPKQTKETKTIRDLDL